MAQPPPTGTLTAANSVLTLAQAILFPTPQQIQQFAADDVLDTDEVRRVETLMGVDGFMSLGYVNTVIPMRIALQPNSPSIAMFETIDTQQQAANDAYPLTGTLIIPGLSKKYILVNGALTGMKVTPDIRRITQVQHFRITWQAITPSPL